MKSVSSVIRIVDRPDKALVTHRNSITAVYLVASISMLAIMFNQAIPSSDSAWGYSESSSLESYNNTKVKVEKDSFRNSSASPIVSEKTLLEYREQFNH